MSNGENAHRVYHFGEYSLDLSREALYHGDRELHLRPKAFRVLRVLLENSGRLISKAELHDAVWKQSVVTDDSLAHCIADIRRALGDSGFEMIKTVPRRGYVLDHAVSNEAGGPKEPPPQLDRYAYGISVVVAGLLAAVMLLLGAGHGGEIPGAEAGIGEDTVATTFAVDRYSVPVGAHNEYEKGQFFFKRRGEGDLDRAEACFKAALEQDPDFGAAWIGLAGVYSVRLRENDLSREEAIPLLGDATGHAIRLAPGSAEAHIRRASYYRVVQEPLLAEQHIERALALDPNDVLVLGVAAGVLAHRNRIDEAIEFQRRAVQGDPTSALQLHNLVWLQLAAGRYPEAAVAAEQYRAIYPPGVGGERDLFADVEILQGNYEQALLEVEKMASGPARDRSLAIVHDALGQQAEAAAALQRLLAVGSELAAIYTAQVFAHRGETDEAMRWLARALDSPERHESTPGQHRQDALWLLSPYLIGLRSDERWQAMYARVLEEQVQTTILALAETPGASGKDSMYIGIEPADGAVREGLR